MTKKKLIILIGGIVIALLVAVAIFVICKNYQRANIPEEDIVNVTDSKALDYTKNKYEYAEPGVYLRGIGDKRYLIIRQKNVRGAQLTYTNCEYDGIECVYIDITFAEEYYGEPGVHVPEGSYYLATEMFDITRVFIEDGGILVSINGEQLPFNNVAYEG